MTDAPAHAPHLFTAIPERVAARLLRTGGGGQRTGGREYPGRRSSVASESYASDLSESPLPSGYQTPDLANYGDESLLPQRRRVGRVTPVENVQWWNKQVGPLSVKWWLVILGVVVAAGIGAFAFYWFVVRPKRASATPPIAQPVPPPDPTLDSVPTPTSTTRLDHRPPKQIAPYTGTDAGHHRKSARHEKRRHRKAKHHPRYVSHGSESEEPSDSEEYASNASDSGEDGSLATGFSTGGVSPPPSDEEVEEWVDDNGVGEADTGLDQSKQGSPFVPVIPEAFRDAINAFIHPEAQVVATLTEGPVKKKPAPRARRGRKTAPATVTEIFEDGGKNQVATTDVGDGVAPAVE